MNPGATSVRDDMVAGASANASVESAVVIAAGSTSGPALADANQNNGQSAAPRRYSTSRNAASDVATRGQRTAKDRSRN